MKVAIYRCAIPPLLTIAFGFVLLFAQAPNDLVENASARLLRGDCLELIASLNPGLDLLVRVVQGDGRIQTLHVVSQIFDGPALMTIRMLVLIHALDFLLLDLQFHRG